MRHLGGVPALASLADRLDPGLFFHAGRGLVVHWRGVGRVARVRRRRKIWLNPPHMGRMGSREEEITHFIPKAHVKVFDQWYENCLERAGAGRKGNWIVVCRMQGGGKNKKVYCDTKPFFIPLV